MFFKLMIPIYDGTNDNYSEFNTKHGKNEFNQEENDILPVSGALELLPQLLHASFTEGTLPVSVLAVSFTTSVEGFLSVFHELSLVIVLGSVLCWLLSTGWLLGCWLLLCFLLWLSWFWWGFKFVVVLCSSWVFLFILVSIFTLLVVSFLTLVLWELFVEPTSWFRIFDAISVLLGEINHAAVTFATAITFPDFATIP